MQSSSSIQLPSTRLDSRDANQGPPGFTFYSSFKNLVNNPEDSDIDFIVGRNANCPRIFHGHQVILKARSTYFRSALTCNRTEDQGALEGLDMNKRMRFSDCNPDSLL